MIVDTNKKYTFSGHETFHCRPLWLKKGYDYVMSGKSFTDEDAVVQLGVGKNMVTAIKYWLKSFNLLDNNEQLTQLAHFIFKNDGFDPYLEDDQTLWILHYNLIKKEFASIYSLIFNEFRKEKIQFTKENFLTFISRSSNSFNTKTVGEDFDVFKKMYLNKSEETKKTEDLSLGLLADLDLLKSVDKNHYYIENTERVSLSTKVLLYSILENEEFGNSISLSALENNDLGPCSIFALNRFSLLDKIEQITQEFNWVVYNDHAGVKELQLKKRPSNLFSIFNEN